MSPKSWYERLPATAWTALATALVSIVLGLFNRLAPAEDLARKSYVTLAAEVERQGEALEDVAKRLERLEVLLKVASPSPVVQPPARVSVRTPVFAAMAFSAPTPTAEPDAGVANIDAGVANVDAGVGPPESSLVPPPPRAPRRFSRRSLPSPDTF